MVDLNKLQEDLQEQASEILRELGLIEELEKYGKVEFEGSLPLNLMTHRDIDIAVFVENEFDLNHYFEAVRYLWGKTLKMELIDNRKVSEGTVGLYIQGKFPSPNGKWKVDIWFKQRESNSGPITTSWLKDNLNPENREVILKIKYLVCTTPIYHKWVRSVDVYDAIINHNASDIEGFYKYLENKGLDLEVIKLLTYYVNQNLREFDAN